MTKEFPAFRSPENETILEAVLAALGYAGHTIFRLPETQETQHALMAIIKANLRASFWKGSNAGTAFTNVNLKIEKASWFRVRVEGTILVGESLLTLSEVYVRGMSIHIKGFPEDHFKFSAYSFNPSPQGYIP